MLKSEFLEKKQRWFQAKYGDDVGNEKFQAFCDVTDRKDIPGEDPKPTIEELEGILNNEEEVGLEILPNGEIKEKLAAPKKAKKKTSKKKKT